jgi:type IV pilus assembly protein PilW
MTHSRLPRARGFTLIELMVGLALGMLILLALVMLFANMSRSNSEMSRTAALVENGRFSLQVLESDLSHGGYWGSWIPGYEDLSLAGAPTDAPATTTDNTVPDPCLAYASWTAAYRTKLIGIPVQVYEIPTSGTPPVCGGVVTNATPAKTDIRNHMIVVRHAAPCQAVASATDTDCRAAVAQEYFQVGRCGSTATVSYTFAQSTNAALTNFTEQNRDCATAAPAYRYISNIYYVRNYAVTAGDGIPTLVRSSFTGTAHASAQALVEGVEAMRIELGADNVSKSGAALTPASFGAAVAWQDPSRQVTPTNRGDGNPDQFIDCTTATPCTAFDQMNTITVRLYVLVRAPTPTPGYTSDRTYSLGSQTLGPYTDGYKRHVYTRTIRLHNVAMRREVPPGT